MNFFLDDRRHRSRREPEMLVIDYATGYCDRSADQSKRTWVLAYAQGKLYLAMKKGEIKQDKLLTTDPATWLDPRECVSPVQFRPSSLWPRAKPEYHRYSYPSNGGDDRLMVFKKHKYPLKMVFDSSQAYHDITEDDHHKQVSLREVETCEVLRRYPHPNIAEYRGVQCSSELVAPRFDLVCKFDTERVTKIVFKRYTSSLHDWVYNGKSVSLTDCLTDIVKGIEHMHALGFVHCDIKPDNIFVDSSILRKTSYVLGDFDSTAQRGSVYNLKGGTEGWCKKKRFSVDRVEEDDDWYSFDILKAWLIRKYNRRARDYDHIGGPRRGRR